MTLQQSLITQLSSCSSKTLRSDVSLIAGIIVLFMVRVGFGDSWAPATDQEYQSNNKEFVFSVKVRRRSEHGSQACRGILKRRVADKMVTLWDRRLVNRVSPVDAMVHDLRGFVVTFDEWHSVGKKPVVIYDANGDLVAELTIADLGLESHPRIRRSVSSYSWNERAVILFGPAAKAGKPWERKLEATLFVRLHWGDLLTIDLTNGKVLTEKDRNGLSNKEHEEFKRAANAFLATSYRRLAREWLREENFNPDPTSDGIRGILLAKELRLREPLPLLKKIAATDRFKHWSAPRWTDVRNQQNVKALAQSAVDAIDSKGSD